MDQPEIRDWHAHVYFDAPTRDHAWALRERIQARFPSAELGRFHEKPVGPHPRFSYQILVANQLFGTLIPWLVMHRQGLTVFVHPNTGADLPDHRDRAIWLGPSEELDLTVLEPG